MGVYILLNEINFITLTTLSNCERLNFSKQNHQRHHDIWNRSAYEFFEQEGKKLFQLRN